MSSIYYSVNSDETCGICLDSTTGRRDAIAHSQEKSNKLLHPVHRNCIKEWFHRTQNPIISCPTCSAPIDINSVTPLKERFFNELKLVAKEALFGVALSGVVTATASAVAATAVSALTALGSAATPALSNAAVGVLRGALVAAKAARGVADLSGSIGILTGSSPTVSSVIIPSVSAGIIGMGLVEVVCGGLAGTRTAEGAIVGAVIGAVAGAAEGTLMAGGILTTLAVVARMGGIREIARDGARLGAIVGGLAGAAAGVATIVGIHSPSITVGETGIPLIAAGTGVIAAAVAVSGFIAGKATEGVWGAAAVAGAGIGTTGAALAGVGAAGSAVAAGAGAALFGALARRKIFPI